MKTSLMTTDNKAVEEIRKQIETVKNIVARDATDEELTYFAQFCAAAGLNPIVNQIHFIKRAGRPTFQTGIDGFRLIAERSGKYAGQMPVEFGPMVKKTLYYKGADKQKKQIIKEVPEFATVSVLREDFKQPLVVTAYWDEFCPSFPNQTMWIKMPRNQLEKVAEAKALRKAFPNDLANMYTDDEMAQAEGVEVQTVTGEVVEVAMNPKEPETKEQKDQIRSEIYASYLNMIADAKTAHQLKAAQKNFQKGLDNNLISQEEYDQLFGQAEEKINKL